MKPSEANALMKMKSPKFKPSEMSAPADIILAQTWMTKAASHEIFGLAARWADECENEDINDYASRIKSMLPVGLNFLHMSSAPFGFLYQVGDRAIYRVRVARSSISMVRVK